MTYQIDEFERVVFNMNNPSKCSYRLHFENNPTKPYSLELLKSPFLLKEKVSSLGIANVQHKTLKNQIRTFQQSSIRTLNRLHCADIFCKYREYCKKQIRVPISNFITDFIDFLHDQFPRHFDSNAKVPLIIFDKYKLILVEKTSLLFPFLKKEDVDILHLTLSEYIYAKRNNCTFRELWYFDSLIDKAISRIKLVKEKSNAQWELIKIVVIYNFNASTIYDYIITFFKRSLDSIDCKSLIINQIKKYQKSIAQIVEDKTLSYLAGKESLKASLINWLKRELHYYNYNYILVNPPTHVKESSSELELNTKIKTNLSVGQIACIIKYLINNNIIDGHNKAETIKQFSEYFTSKNADEISIKSLSNKYYELDETTLKSTKKIFLDLFKSIEL